MEYAIIEAWGGISGDPGSAGIGGDGGSVI